MESIVKDPRVQEAIEALIGAVAEALEEKNEDLDVDWLHSALSEGLVEAIETVEAE